MRTMTENNVPNHIPNNMDVVVVIDKEKLPEDVRKLLEENLPKDVQEKVLKMLGRPPPISDKTMSEKLSDKSALDSIDKKSYDQLKDNRLFAIQTGTVVGNIYTDGTYKKEEDSYTKKKDIKDTEESKMLPKDLGGCC